MRNLVFLREVDASSLLHSVVEWSGGALLPTLARKLGGQLDADAREQALYAVSNFATGAPVHKVRRFLCLIVVLAPRGQQLCERRFKR